MERKNLEDTSPSMKKIWTDKSFLAFLSIALLSGLLSYAVGGTKALQKGLEASWDMMVLIIPRLIAAFLLAGFIQVLIPKNLILRWIGDKSGLRGILIAFLAGVLTPAGPMISFPIVASLHHLGAHYAPLIAYLTSWELFGFMRIAVWEMPFMGLKFVLFRVAVSFTLPLLAGFAARKIVRHLGGTLGLEKD